MQCGFFHFFRLCLFPFRGCSLFGLLFWPLSTPEVHPQKKIKTNKTLQTNTQMVKSQQFVFGCLDWGKMSHIHAAVWPPKTGFIYIMSSLIFFFLTDTWKFCKPLSTAKMCYLLYAVYSVIVCSCHVCLSIYLVNFLTSPSVISSRVAAMSTQKCCVVSEKVISFHELPNKQREILGIKEHTQMLLCVFSATKLLPESNLK